MCCVCSCVRRGWTGCWIYKRLDTRGRVLLLCLLCAEAGCLILVNARLRLERAYLKLRLFLRV